MVLFRRFGLLLGFVVLSSSCGGGGPSIGSVAGDSDGRPEDRVCNTVYYREIIGTYLGQITAKEFAGRERVDLLNQCDWDVSVSIEEVKTPALDGRYGCLMRATYEARLISQTNNSSSLQYQCVEMKDVVNVSDPHPLDSESWNAPVWPIDLSALPSYEYHPFNNNGTVISPQTGGTVDGAFDMRVAGDGSLNFEGNAIYQSTQLEGLLTKE